MDPNNQANEVPPTPPLSPTPSNPTNEPYTEPAATLAPDQAISEPMQQLTPDSLPASEAEPLTEPIGMPEEAPAPEAAPLPESAPMPMPEALPAEAPVAPAVVTPSVMQAVVSPDVAGGSPAAAMPLKAKRSFKKPIIIGLIALVVVLIISAVTYAAVILPNTPTNTLFKAIGNSIAEKELTYKGKFEISQDGSSYKVGLAGSQDNNRGFSDVKLDVTAVGATIPLAARYVDKNLYVKIGDLSSVSNLLNSYGASEYAPVVTLLNQQLAEKWIAIDSTLIKSSGASCYTDVKFALTEQDGKLLYDAYKVQPFATIVSHSPDSVNGAKAEKYVLSIDDDKAAAYGMKLSDLSIVKAFKACNKDATSNKSTAKGDHETTPMTIWVDNATKHVVQLATQSTASDAKKGTTGNLSITFVYKPVKIVAPSDAIPALDVLANLQAALGGGAGGSDGAALAGLLGGLGGGY
ncbi:MAG: hypothetical protein ABIV43_03870 [Candidatus Saccharimonadales bacterium]